MAYDRSNFGKPKHGGNGYRHFKLAPGSNPYRIGPAFKSLAASGKWNTYLRQHFGYRSGGDEQNPKGFVRTFVCPLEIDKRTEMVKTPCAECDKIADMKALLEKRTAEKEAEIEAGTCTRQEADSVLGPIKSWLKEHNVDKKYLLLAKNMKGEWGVLSIPYTAKKNLDDLVKKMRNEDGIDPLDPDEGCWIDFERTGEGLKTDYKVNPLMENIIAEGGKRAKVVKTYQLVDADYEAIETECPDLTTVGRVLTQEQINALVESNGDPEEVDRIFNAGRREASPAAKVVKTEDKVVAAEATYERRPVVAPKSETIVPRKEVPAEVRSILAEAKQVAAKAETAEQSPKTDAEKIAALQAQLAALQAPKAAPPSAPVKEEEVSDEEMSDEEFLALHRRKLKG